MGKKGLSRILTMLLLAAAVACCTGCTFFGGPLGSLFTELPDASREDRLYNEAAEQLFAALDQGDAGAVRALFSPHVQQTDPDLDQQLEALLAVYPGPTDGNTWEDAMRAGHYSNEHGVHTALTYATFPVVSDGVYYWCHLELCYENEADSDRVGITKLLFYTAEDYCLCRYDENWTLPETPGLTVFAEAELDCQVRAVQGYPYQYTPADTPLDPAEVKDFLNQSNSYDEFAARFGQPNAVHIYEIYELLPEDGCPRYLQLSIDRNEIHSASVVDDLDWLYSLWKK